MLVFFRNNQFFTVLPLTLFVILVHSGALLGRIPVSLHSGKESLLYQELFGWLATAPYYSAVIAVILVIVQAVSVNLLADEFRLMGERNWFPGLFYALGASAFPELLFVSGPLVAASFVPFSLWAVYKAYQKPNVHGAIFDGAFWLAISSLFYPSAILLLVAAFAGFGVIRSFKLQERFVFLTGAFVPLFLMWVWYFWKDQGGAFRNAQWGDLFQFVQFEQGMELKSMLKLGLAILWIIAILFGLGSSSGRKGIQAQKYVSVLYWFLSISLLSLFSLPIWAWEHLVLSASAMAILLTFSFQGILNRLWAELGFLVLLGFVFYIQFADYLLTLFGSVF